jgi:hypothetical protein
MVSMPAGGWFAGAFRRHYGQAWVQLGKPNVEELAMKRVKLGEVSAGSTATHLAPVESDVFSRLMSIVSHCCVTRYEDGELRQPGWVTIKTLGSSWAVQIKDPDACASMQAIGASLDDALTLADLLLSSDQAPWEHDRFLAQQRSSASKKK